MMNGPCLLWLRRRALLVVESACPRIGHGAHERGHQRDAIIEWRNSRGRTSWLEMAIQGFFELSQLGLVSLQLHHLGDPLHERLTQGLEPLVGSWSRHRCSRRRALQTAELLPVGLVRKGFRHESDLRLSLGEPRLNLPRFVPSLILERRHGR